MEIAICAFIGVWIAAAGFIAGRSLERDFNEARKGRK